MAQSAPSVVGAKATMDLGDPFAAFLTVRKSPAQLLDTSRIQPLWGPREGSKTAAHGDELAADPFASFIALRPPKTSTSPESTLEQSLREDLLRTKRRLLEVGLKAELKALDPSCPAEAAERLRRVRKAQRYLQNPERTLEPLSQVASDSSGDDAGSLAPSERPAVHVVVGRGSGNDPACSSFGSPVVDEAGSAMVLLRSVSKKGQLSYPGSTMLQASASMPNLQQDNDAEAPHATLLPPITGGVSHKTPVPAKASLLEEKSPLVQGWWSRTRSWNIGFSNKELTAKRHNLSMSGGTVVLGNGRIPVFTGSHLLSTGYFYAFQVDALDDEHFPLEGLRDLSFGFGVSRHPAQHRSCERPVFAYEIPGVVLLGYGDHLIDKSKWWHTGWNPRDLRERDVVGLLIPPEGDLILFVNEQQVLRVQLAWQRMGTSGSPAPVTAERSIQSLISTAGSPLSRSYRASLRPTSLCNAAVSSGDTAGTSFLHAMLQRSSATRSTCCQRLLQGAPHGQLFLSRHCPFVDE
eukprot:CAMPEP_0171107490 /NCGR_PEP_ID=MMETSP0766_2-20121228/66927_1 /TAXON_ID=439317 /ORGANISM="Gambierdiscus australes, Strain CAWD 149" /LENGTH=520 /DNA_ID=CAMNT_0011568805 /DNA_START=35 /DNA_END=1598 /DNA_ORIENTATION=+